MSKQKKFSFIRYFDIFAPPYYQKINQDHYKKKTVIGGVFSIIYVSASLGYFLYLMIYFYQGKISPKFNQFDEVQDEGIEYQIASEALFIQILQDGEDIIEIEKQNKIQYFDIYLKNQDRQINSYYYDNLIRFGESGNTYLSLKSEMIPLQGDGIEFTIEKCSGNLLRDQTYRCASENEIQELLQKQDLGVILSIGDLSFSIKNNEKKTRVFLSISSISLNSQAINLINLQLQQIQVQKGLLFQTSKKYVQIADLSQQTAQYTNRSPKGQPFCSMMVILNNVVKQTQVQYPLLSEVLAYVWGIASMLLLTGYIFKCIAEATLAQDFLGIQLKYYYKKTAIRLFGKADNEKINNTIIESKQEAEAILKQNETNKDMCVFEMQKEFLKMRTAIKLLLTPEQYSAIQMCGCDLINEELNYQNDQNEDQKAKDNVSNSQKEMDDKVLDLEISDIHSPLNKYQLDQSIQEVSQQKALNHLEIMNKVDTDNPYRQDCLQRFLNDNQFNYSKDQQENLIFDEDASSLGSGLGQCTNLSNLTLNLYWNRIGDKGALDLGFGLGKCTSLSNLTLYIQRNLIGGEGASGLGSGLGKCTNLSNLTLNLGHNQIGDEGASGLGSGLGKCTNLSNLTLYLQLNQIGVEGVLGLGSGLGKCTNLSNLALYLWQNYFDNEGASSLGSGLGKCTNLSNLTLDLWDNQIGDEGASGLGSGLGKCTNLSNLTLNLQYKQFTY
ncbi:transmembrane protein, putative (macronuclear) [Tetrahymena thermophila SB210]|uniref:Transmembrane protein, putative n=1 Tax=Tetrahymena thermophila (strain SB210) TaxID=312017 RepID=Q239Q0_TETTS|nr:transmembrane protein, putative [Tetrahymena thermophila SB210]EAR93265.2 transmembrane protein, putative [Tetrahymena thermophila SB210]|eukprot:XP_001013510.2 transmembrane protein, putative [Tetrahymena thermophila SB210]